MISIKEQAKFMNKIRCMDCENFLKQYFLYSASPVIRGVKPSVLITLKNTCKEAFEEMKEMLCHNTGLKTEELYFRRDFFSILIYDENVLLKVLLSNKARELLNKRGYVKYDLDNLLKFLKYKFKTEKFPHEIGVFLGYPPEDVESFILHEGKNYTCCNYWKVYHNEEKAHETFRLIDEAKTYAIKLLSEQKSHIYQVAKLLKTI